MEISCPVWTGWGISRCGLGGVSSTCIYLSDAQNARSPLL